MRRTSAVERPILSQIVVDPISAISTVTVTVARIIFPSLFRVLEKRLTRTAKIETTISSILRGVRLSRSGTVISEPTASRRLSDRRRRGMSIQRPNVVIRLERVNVEGVNILLLVVVLLVVACGSSADECALCLPTRSQTATMSALRGMRRRSVQSETSGSCNAI